MANIYRPFPGDITRVHGIRVGQAQNAQAMTGVTVVLPQAEGAVGGVSVRGAAPSASISANDRVMPFHSSSVSRRQGCSSTQRNSRDSSLKSMLMRRMNSSSHITA